MNRLVAWLCLCLFLPCGFLPNRALAEDPLPAENILNIDIDPEDPLDGSRITVNTIWDYDRVLIRAKKKADPAKEAGSGFVRVEVQLTWTTNAPRLGRHCATRSRSTETSMGPPRQ